MSLPPQLFFLISISSSLLPLLFFLLSSSSSLLPHIFFLILLPHFSFLIYPFSYRSSSIPFKIFLRLFFHSFFRLSFPILLNSYVFQSLYNSSLSLISLSSPLPVSSSFSFSALPPTIFLLFLLFSFFLLPLLFFRSYSLPTSLLPLLYRFSSSHSSPTLHFLLTSLPHPPILFLAISPPLLLPKEANNKAHSLLFFLLFPFLLPLEQLTAGSAVNASCSVDVSSSSSGSSDVAWQSTLIKLSKSS